MSCGERLAISIPLSFVTKRMPSWLGNLGKSADGEHVVAAADNPVP
jgi:hypothetical protein